MSDSALLAHDRARGVRLIAGVDEVGRACLAGPIMAAGVLFDLERLASGAGRNLLEELDDSKRVGRAKRERLAQAVLAHAEARGESGGDVGRRRVTLGRGISGTPSTTDHREGVGRIRR